MAGCAGDHHYLLHPTKQGSLSNVNEPQQVSTARTTAAKPQSQLSTSVNNSATVAHSDTVTISSVKASRPRVCFKVVPVKVSSRNSDKAVYTNAFFDSGSDATLCLNSLVNDLGIKDAKPTSYVMSTVDCEEHKSGYTVELNIESLEGNTKFCLENVLTTRSLPVVPKHVASKQRSKAMASS